MSRHASSQRQPASWSSTTPNWTEEDYTSALREAGLTITAIDYPMPRDPSAWSTDEALLSPCIVLTATKS